MKDNRFYATRPYLVSRMSEEAPEPMVNWFRVGLALTMAVGFGVGLASTELMNAVSNINLF